MNTRYLIAVLAAAALPALAQTTPPETPRVDKREANQEARIQQGAASGELNGKETARLERGQAHVRTLEDKAKADGTVTNKERAQLHRAQDRQSKHIYRQKHDAQKAPAAGA
jgi:hypothetical protein